jgi:hypothetical protein
MAVLRKGAYMSAERTLPMREIPDPTANDLPKPAPGGTQSIVNSRPRTPGEVAREQVKLRAPAQDPLRFHGSNGARFEAVIQTTDVGPQASFGIYADVPGGTITTTDIHLFDTDEAAVAWLDQHAASRGFKKYPLDRRK